MGVLASDSINDPKQPKQSDRQDSPSLLTFCGNPTCEICRAVQSVIAMKADNPELRYNQNRIHEDDVMARTVFEQPSFYQRMARSPHEQGVTFDFPPMLEGQNSWSVRNAMAFITPEQKPTPDTRTRFQRLIHRILKRLWEWSEVWELYLYGKMRHFASEQKRRDSINGPVSFKITRIRATPDSRVQIPKDEVRG